MIMRLVAFSSFVILAMLGQERSTSNSFVTSEIGWWVIAALIVLFVFFVEQKPLASVGFRAITFQTFVTAAVGLAAAVGLIGIAGAIAPHVGVDLAGTEDKLESVSSTPMALLALSVIRAGVVEELFFRGYLISRSLDLGLHPALALLASTALFTTPHALFWGWAHLLIVAIGGLSFGTIFLWKRDLIACMLAHIGFNVGGLVAAAAL